MQVVAAAEDADTASALRAITDRLTGEHILVRCAAPFNTSTRESCVLLQQQWGECECE